MSRASCNRPSDLASANVSINWSDLTPATGIIRFTFPTKFETVGDGAGAAGVSSVADARGSVSSGGNGDPIATGVFGRLGEISIAGTLGVVRKLIASDTSETITRNRTQRRIRNFTVPIARTVTTNVPNQGAIGLLKLCNRFLVTFLLLIDERQIRCALGN